MTTKDITYNGWANYSTWAVNLWLMNEGGPNKYWTGLAMAAAQRISEIEDEDEKEAAKEVATYDLADQLKDEHEEALPELNGFAADLLNHAFAHVDWNEIAGHLIEDELSEIV